MHFAVSGVVCPIWLPPLVAFVVALLTTPAGVSGAFLLLPFQISVLGFVAPAVTPTNLVYNIVAIPGGVYRYIREHRMAWPLVGAVTAGTIPGIVIGSLIRIHYLPGPRRVKLFIALVLLYLAFRLFRDTLAPAVHKLKKSPTASLTAMALVVGLIGGIYGVGGGAIIAPFAMTSLGLPAKVIAGPSLLATLITSLVGIGSFEVLRVRPDWTLGLLFGAGGLAGSYCGARLQKHLPDRYIRLFLGLLLAGLSATYIFQFFH